MYIGEILKTINKTDKLPDELFVEILETQDSLERAEIVEDAKRALKPLGRTREFTKLLGLWQTKYAQDRVQQNSNKTEFTGQPLQLFTGKYICRDEGIFYEKTSNNNTFFVNVCPHPILPSERLVNIDTGSEKMKLVFFRDHKWKEVAADCEVLYSRINICRLANRGVLVTTESAKELVKYLAEVISKNAQLLPKYDSISRFGWVEGNRFAPYDNDIRYDGDEAFSNIYTQLKEDGDFGVWLEHMNKLRSNIYIRLLMATSFASPLIEKVGALPFVTHLWGTTGFGKTVSLMVAMSIWGNPELGGLVRTMNMTQNAMARTSAFLCNIPFAADELQQIKTKWDNYDNLIMYLTEGIDRGRAKARGGVEEVKTWKNSFIFTGEEPITKADSGGGSKNRVIELEVDDKIIEDGNLTANIIKNNYGFAGKMFINYIKNLDTKSIQERYRNVFKKIIENIDTTDKQAMSMALIILADELACEAVFITEDPLKVDDVSKFLATNKAVDSSVRAYDWAVNWVAENQIRFSHTDNNGAIWGQINDDFAFINKKVLEEALKKNGFDYTATTKGWAKTGLISRNSEGKYVHRRTIANIRASYIKLHFRDEEPEIDDIADVEEVKNLSEIPF